MVAFGVVGRNVGTKSMVLRIRANKVWIILGTKTWILYIGAIDKGTNYGTKYESLCWARA